MLLGLSLAQFTLLHVIITLIAIAAGVIFFGALSSGRWLGFINGLFLDFTILTSITGFMFPIKGPTPALIFGGISLVPLAVALIALYALKLRGAWRRIYLIVALIAQWLNMVVLVIQSFLKIPALHALAPKGNEPPILVGQAIMFLIVAYFAWKTIVRTPPVPATA